MIPQGLLSVVPQLEKKTAPIVAESKEIIEEEPENEKDGDGITDENKRDWNSYLFWLDKKGMKGKPELDKGGLGNKLFQEYLKENPETTLSKDIVPKIRKAYIELRNSGIQDILSGKSYYKDKSGKEVTGKGVDVSSFMRHIVDNENSADPNYVGQHLTQTLFPGAILKPKPGMIGTIEKVEFRKPSTTKELFKINK